MKKRSKLLEKPSRIPEIREVKFEAKIIPDYIASVKSQNSESAKSQRFLLLLNELFGVQPGFIEDYVSGIEKYVKVKQKDRFLKGRVDELFGNLIIEFERDLVKMRTEAEEQLRKYVACLWSQEISDRTRQEPRSPIPYLCIAGDGISFTVYSPVIQDTVETEIQPDDVQLELIEQVDLSTLKPTEVYFWLDRYFLRFLKGKFDFIVGNPPWLSYRYVEQLDYQKFLKNQITETYSLLKGRGELITNLELGTLFLVRTADLYLKESGTIAFVLPRSIFTADQHDALRQGKFKGVNLVFKESWDLEEITPLFNVPSCVLIAQKPPTPVAEVAKLLGKGEKDAKVSYPIAGQKFSGELPLRNAALSEAEQYLTVEDVQWSLSKMGKRSF